MNNKKFHIIAFVVMMWNFSFAQLHKNYTISDGLPSNHVYRITQDSKGFIWALTDKGIARFNGKEFTVFTTKNGLPTNDIWDMREGPDHKMWYFSKSSIIGYIQNDLVYNFSACIENDILYPSQVYEYGNTILFGNSDKCYALVDGCWKHIRREMAIQTTVWNENMGEAAIIAGLAYFYYHNSESFEIDDPMSYSGLRYLVKDSINGLLYDEGYKVFNLNNQKVYHGKFGEGFQPAQPIFTRFHFVNGEIQLSGFNVVAILDEAYQPKQVIDISEEIESHFSMVDRSGNIWSCTFTNGIYMLPQVHRKITYHLLDHKINRIDILKDNIVASVRSRGFYEYNEKQRRFNPLIEDDGFIYSASYIEPLQSSFYFSETKIIQKTKDAGVNIMSNVRLGVRSLFFENDTIYTTTSGGVQKRKLSDFSVLNMKRQYGINDVIYFQDRVILGTSNGLKTMVKDSIYELVIPNAPLPEPILNLTEVSPDQLLIGTDGFGAYLTNLEQITPLSGSEFLSVQDAFIANDGFWLATEIGALQYKKTKQGFELLRKVDESDGLPSRKINSVVEFGNEIMVATDNGIAIFPENLEKSPQFLDIYIQKGRFNESAMFRENASFQFTKGNHVTFTIASIDFSERIEPLEYEYMLSPSQTEWVSSNSESLIFADLKPDDYSFTVRSHGIEKSMSFSVKPLWWQTQWFRVIGLLGLLILLGSSIFFILKTFQKKQTRKLVQEKQLAQIQLKALRSQMNPHFVFNSLSAIQYYINNNDFEASETYLVKFSKLIRTFFELSKESEITIHDEVELLTNYLDLEKLRFRGKFDYYIDIDPKLNGKTGKIPAMLLQPIVENAINHGIFNKEEKGKVSIGFQKIDESQLIVTIEDDGVGMVNTVKEGTRKMKSSNVLNDRLYYLNQSLRWRIDYNTREAFPGQADRGNISTFTIKRKT